VLDLQNYPQLLAFLHSVVWLSAWFVLITIVFMPFERLFAVKPRKILTRGFAGDLGFYFISGLVPGLLLTPVLAIAAYAGTKLVPYPIQLAVAEMPLWARVLAALFVSEIGFYWGHRWAHEIPFLWRFHSIHHDPKDVYFLISARAHPLDNIFIRLCGLLPVVILGFATPLTPEGGMISAFLVLVLKLWGYLIHANLRWRYGPLEWLIATPAFHHWHHTLHAPRDRNYASMLPCMDWLFGTYYLPKDRWPTAYGIDAEIPQTLHGQLLYPFLPATAAPARPSADMDNAAGVQPVAPGLPGKS